MPKAVRKQCNTLLSIDSFAAFRWRIGELTRVLGERGGHSSGVVPFGSDYYSRRWIYTKATIAVSRVGREKATAQEEL
jgi:hypothetical protein